jgi:hypothetical protein
MRLVLSAGVSMAEPPRAVPPPKPETAPESEPTPKPKVAPEAGIPGA